MTSFKLGSSHIAAVLLASVLWIVTACDGAENSAKRHVDVPQQVPESSASAETSPPPSRLPTAPPSPSQPPAQPLVTTAPSLTPLVEAVRSAVINVEVTARTPALATPFSNSGPSPHDMYRQGIGSGFIISADGKALTNNHVVEGAEHIRVNLEDGRSFDAEVIGRDPLTDVALIRMKGKPSHLPMVRLGNSDALRVGDWVVAIGNPFGLTSSVSAGIVSALDRNIGAGPYDDFLQTDAAINPGNSGGPLFNLSGEVVGINTAIAGEGTGIGFAVPSNLVQSLLPQLEKEGVVTRGWLGVSVQALTPELAQALHISTNKGALVSEVTPASPADRGGLKVEDVIVSVDKDNVESGANLTQKIALKKPGSTVTLTLYRDGQREEKKVRVDARPDLEGTALGQANPGTSENSKEAQLGLSLQDIDTAVATRHGIPPGVLIVDVVPGSVADSADLQPGMVIIEVGGKAVHTTREIRDAVKKARSGEVILLRVQAGEAKVLRAITVP